MYFEILSKDTIKHLLAQSLNSFQDIAGWTITAVIGVAVLLIGAGFVWSRFKRYISGKKI